MNWKELSDQRLVELCLEGNHDAWVEFLRRHRPLINIVIRTTIDTNSRHDDLLQETLAKIVANDCRALRELKWEHEGALRGFLRRTAINVALDWHRHENAEKRPPIDKEIPWDDFVEPAPRVDPNTERNNKLYVEELLKCLKGVVQEEPDWQRDIDIFWFYYGYGFTAKDLARIYKMDIRKVENTAARLARLIRGHCL